MFCFIFQIIHTMNANDNHSQDALGHAMQLQNFVYDIYALNHVHIVFF